MKVLVISSAAVQRSWQNKFIEIAKDTSIHITLLLPSCWVENYRKVFPDINSDNKINYIVAKGLWSGYGSRYFFITKFYSAIKELQPDIIHLEQEPWSLIALQTVFYRNILSPRSKIIFRTSRTFDVKLKFKYIARFIEKYIYSNSSYALPLNKQASIFLISKGYKKKLTIIPNGVDMKLFRPMNNHETKKKLGFDQIFTIGYFGRFIKEKGMDTLFGALDNLNAQCQVLLIGDGPYKKNLQILAKKLGIQSRLIMIDTLPPEQLPPYINCMDVFVLPSYKVIGWEEFFGRALIEAMACGVPVIGADSGGMPSVIGSAGLLFPEKNHHILADHLRGLIDDQLYRKELAVKGKVRVQKYYSWNIIANQIMHVYKEITESV